MRWAGPSQWAADVGSLVGATRTYFLDRPADGSPRFFAISGIKNSSGQGPWSPRVFCPGR